MKEEFRLMLCPCSLDKNRCPEIIKYDDGSFHIKDDDTGESIKIAGDQMKMLYETIRDNNLI